MTLYMNKLIEPPIQIDEVSKRYNNRQLTALIVPIIIEQFLTYLVGMVDTLMISYAGKAAISGVSLIDQVNNIFIMVFTALSAGGAVVISQYVGNENSQNSSLSAGQLVTIMTSFGIIGALGIILFGRQMFGLLFHGVEDDVATAGLTYLRISAYSYPFLAIYNAGAGICRSTGKTRDIMHISIIMNGMNVIGNAIGIFVLHAGVLGVAVPSLLSRMVAACIVIERLIYHQNLIELHWNSFFHWNQNIVWKILRIALPGGFENGLFQLTKVALSVIVAMFGTTQIAAYGVSQSCWMLSSIFYIAMQPVFITVIGQCMGAGNTDGAEYYLRKLLRITEIGSFIWIVVFIAASPLFLQLYSLDRETLRLVQLILIVHTAFNTIFSPIAFPFAEGLRAAGDVKYTMLTAIFSTVICRSLFAVLFAVVLKLHVMGIILAMAVDWMVRAGLIWKRYKDAKWKQFKVI